MKRLKSMQTTIKELAAELKLSSATVSMALRQSPLIARQTRDRINRLAAQRGYIRNNAGAALKLRRTNLIGFLFRGAIHSFYNEVLQGAGEIAAAEGYGLLLGWVSPESDPASQIRLMLEKNVDALIVADKLDSAETLLAPFFERHKPVVYCTGEAAANCSSVCNDDVLGGRLAVEVLARNGHRKILASTQWKARYLGNCTAAEEAGIEVIPYAFPDEAIRMVLQDSSITAIASYADEEAIKLLHGLRSQNVRVPEDVSVIGFDDLPICELPEFRLTTIAQQRSRLGEEAVRLAVRQALSGRISPVEHIVLAPEPVIRDTVAAPYRFQSKNEKGI